ncbi:MAG: FG-GAP-like repeat-containing protein [Saprospiraceae bacterium]
MKKTILIYCCFLVAFSAVGQLYYSNVADAVGIQHSYIGILGGGVSFVDFDNDGLDDLTIATGEGEPIHFYKNNGNGFTKISPPIADLNQAKQILWVDFDNDGDYDLYVANFGSANRLYKNIGQFIFEDITENAGLPINDHDTYGACFGDIDRDGWLDLYYCDRIPFMTSENRHYLFKNNADGTFTDITETSQTKDGGKVPFCSAFIDYNNDKWPDIYTAHDKINIANVLLENNGNETFTDVSVPSNSDLKMDAMCVNPGDYNNDGWMDIYITNTANGGSALLHNIGPGGGGQVKFGNSALFAGVTFSQRTGWGSVFLDADNDSDLDLYVTAADYGDIAQSNAFYLNNGTNTFSQPDVGFDGDTTITYNTAIGDFNSDGFPDIIVLNQTPFFTQLWENNGGNNYWIKIKLQGVLSNRDAIGSKIETYSGGQYQMRYTLCGNGFLGQNSLTEIIGLNNNEKVDSIIITWPTGHIDKLFDVENGSNLIVIEGSTSNGNIIVDEEVELTLPPTNVISKNSEKPFSIFPNPASQSLNILNNGSDLSQLFILNNKGQIIQSLNPNMPKWHLNISSFLPGHYYLLSIDKKGEKHFEKWVKL